MKKNIHPSYNLIKSLCSCGNVMSFFSTLNKDIHLDVCYRCHPFYTGKQRTLDKGGQIEKFNKRFSMLNKL
ncbi:50S ribosomal protein L31 [Buchnera aphidicola (Formosaphis micheliae)]|uniref:50S ribosomal protein L31 n=1 Tax=Buchnera aphidicola TaxID=9 RepID=UPI0031B81B17